MSKRISFSCESLISITVLSNKDVAEIFKAIADYSNGIEPKVEGVNKTILDGILSKAKITVRKESKAAKKSKKEREKDFYNSLANFVGNYPKKMLREFYEYWTESSQSDKKMRFEKEKTFDISRRLKTWKENEIKFNPQNKEEKQAVITEQPHPDK